MDLTQGDRGDGTGLLGAKPEQLVQLCRVVEVGLAALLNRSHEIGHDRSEVLLQVAVALARIVGDQVVDAAAESPE
jgi:hypothetical protein